MYSTCLHCYASLASNEVIEQFPLGRRLAFDASKGRLWVVCTSCDRWNLTPLEERWEAIEECERLFRGALRRVATDNIGLARVGDRTDLIRIGAPLRPEMAAWRYGRELAQRWRRSLPARAVDSIAWNTVLSSNDSTRDLSRVSSGGGGLAALFVINPYLALMAAGTGVAWLHFHRRRVVSVLRAPDGKHVVVRRAEAPRARLGTDPEHGWKLVVRHDTGRVTFTGRRAVDALGSLMSGINRWGATQRQIEMATAKLEHFGSSDRVLAFAAERYGDGELSHLGSEQRLAVEMAAHEDLERGALQGELAELEGRWRAAEEIASIADALLTPASVEQRLQALQLDHFRRG